MKIVKHLIIFIFLGTSILVSAQSSVKGTLVSQDEMVPVPYAQLALFSDSVPVSSTTSNVQGKFELNIAEGSYILKVFSLGFKDYEMNINVSGETNLGMINLVPSSQQLNEVVIESEVIRKPIETNLEGLLVRPDQILSNDGGTVLDILRNTPSINVSDDGTVSVRGSSGTNVLIDGRNSALGGDLDQIPASAVDKIQIINNPNAKYDASASGGIIDIKLKKGKGKGTTGTAQLTAGTRGRTNTSLRVNHRADKFSLYGGYTFRYWPNLRFRDVDREVFSTNEVLAIRGVNEIFPTNHTLNYGGDYFFGRHKLSYEGAYLIQERNENRDTRAQAIIAGQEDPSIEYTRLGDVDNSGRVYDNAFILEYGFRDTTKSWRSYLSHSFRDRYNTQTIDVYSGTINPGGEDPTGRERFLNDRNVHVGVAQTDYAQNLFSGKFETGLKYNFREINDDFTYEISEGKGPFENQENVSNDFVYREQVSAGYAIYSREIGRLNISAGARVEWSLIDTEQRTTGETNRQNYVDLFPSASAIYSLDKKNSLKFTYSRRIDRPNGWQLNPFPDVTDTLSQRWGNPNLIPQYINSFELGHSLTLDKMSLTSVLFYRRSDNFIDFLVRIENGVSIVQPQNLNYGETFGLELIHTAEISDWWNVNGSVSFFGQFVDGTNIDDQYINSGLTWSAKISSDFDLPYDVDLQIVGNYTAPEIEAQGRDLPRYFVDATLQRKFFQNKLTASLIFRDVFDIREFRGENSGDDFYQEIRFKGETRIILGSLKYNF
jgi:outer membrane receptor protein involved in Fe transport